MVDFSTLNVNSIIILYQSLTQTRSYVFWLKNLSPCNALSLPSKAFAHTYFHTLSGHGGEKNVGNALYESDQLQVDDCGKVKAILKKIVSEGRITTGTDSFDNDTLFVKTEC